MTTVVVTLGKASSLVFSECSLESIQSCDVVIDNDAIMWAMGKANRTDVVADDVVTDAIAIKVVLVEAN